MKKLLSVLAILLAVFVCNAQVYLFQEDFEAEDFSSDWTTLDNDWDGYNWYVIYGEDYEAMAHTGIGNATSASYQNSTALTPDNWLITKGIEIPANADQPTLSWWAKGQDPSWAAEHYAVYISTTGQTAADFTTVVYEGEPTGEYVEETVDLSDYAGQTIYVAFRHYNITDMFRLNIDDIAVYFTPTEPVLLASPTSIDFGNVFVNETASKTANVIVYDLTDDITISTESPFALSLDGTDYATSVSMPAAGGTLYVQFAPTSTDASEGTVTLTSGELNATITLAGSGFECGTITTFPYNTSFETSDVTVGCWQIVDANGDADEDGSGTWSFESDMAIYYYSSEVGDDWLISPEIRGTNLSASFYYGVYSSSYPETFSVYVIPEGETYENAVEVVAPMTVNNSQYWEELSIDLSAYDDQTIRVAIRATSEDRWALYISNFTVNSVVNTYEITATANPAEGGTIEGADTYEEGVTATLIATANEGFTFTCWTKDGDTVSNEATYTFTVTEDAAFVANFTAITTTTYEITATANPAEGGTIEGADTYEEGATATLIATANTGYTFTCWTKDGDTVSTEATYTFTVTATAEFVANFERIDGIHEVAASNISIYNYDNQIVVKNAEGLSVAIYDINGRLIVNENKVSQSECRYTVSTSGIYLVRVGESVAKKVAVLNR